MCYCENGNSYYLKMFEEGSRVESYKAIESNDNGRTTVFELENGTKKIKKAILTVYDPSSVLKPGPNVVEKQSITYTDGESMCGEGEPDAWDYFFDKDDWTFVEHHSYGEDSLPNSLRFYNSHTQQYNGYTKMECEDKYTEVGSVTGDTYTYEMIKTQAGAEGINTNLFPELQDLVDNDFKFKPPEEIMKIFKKVLGRDNHRDTHTDPTDHSGH